MATVALSGIITPTNVVTATSTTTLTNKTLTSPTVTGVVVSDGTANGVTFLNGSKVLTSGSALTFDGATIGWNATNIILNATSTASSALFRVQGSTGDQWQFGAGHALAGDWGVTNNTRSITPFLITGGTTSPVFTFGGSSEYMRLTSTGLGIGTSSPSAKLDVAGSSYVRGDSTDATFTSAGQLAIKRSSSDPFLSFHNNTGGQIGFIQMQNSGACAIGVAVAQPLAFNTNGSERARIDSSGNFLVGTTNAALNGRGVNSSVFKNLTTQDTLGLNQSTNSYYNLVSVVSTTSGTRYHVGFGDGNSSFAERGSISTNGTSTSYTTTSDYRLKENIQPMQNALAKVVALKPCTYTWKSNGSNGEGFIAHELQEVVPQCVSGEKDAENEDGKPKYQGVDTSFLVATLTAAIQEQQAIIESLKARLDAANL